MRCEDFESLPLGSRLTVYATNPVYANRWQPPNGDYWCEEFVFANGVSTNQGFSRITAQGMAGGSEKEVQINNVLLCFGASTGQTLSGISFKFGEYGGNLNLILNREFRNFSNFAELNGTVIGGVQVSVADGTGNDTGEIKFAGDIRDDRQWGHLAIGGQELWIDDFCFD